MRSSSVAGSGRELKQKRLLYRQFLATIFGLLLFIPVALLEEASSGRFVVLMRLRDVAIFVIWSQAILLTGVTVTQRFRREMPSAVLEGSISLLAGIAVMGGALMLLGLAGFFGTTLLRVFAILVVFLVFSVDNVANFGKLGERVHSELVELFTGVSGRGLAFVTLGITLALLLMSLGPEVSWDGAMYHLDIPAQFIRDGRVSLPDDNLHVAFISAPQMVAAVPIAAGTVAYLAFSRVLAFLGTILLVGTSLRRWLSARAGKLAMILVLASTGLLAVSSIGQVDAIMVLGVLTVLLMVISSHIDGWTPDPVLLGLVVGAAFLTKYQAVPYLLGIAALMGYLLARRSIDMSPRTMLSGLVVTAALIGPFLLKNWMLLGGPLYPFFSPRVVEPWFAEAGLRLANDTELPSVLAQARTHFNPVDWVLQPEVLTVEGTGQYFGFPMVYLLGFLAIFTRRRRLATYLVVPAILGLVLVVWVSPATNLRYLLPILPVFAILTSIVVVTITENLGHAGLLTVLLGIVIATMVPFFGWIAGEAAGGRLAVGAGVESEVAWYSRPSNVSLSRLHGLAEAIHSDLNDAGRVLLLYESRGLELGPKVIQDNVNVSWPLLADALQRSCFSQSQVSHVVYGSDLHEYLLSKGVPEEELRAEAWESFKERCLELETTLPGYEVYRVVDH